MTKKKTLFAILLISALLFAVFQYIFDKEGYNTRHITNDGKKWRIAYLEGGPYINYTHTIRAVANGFIELGWMEEIMIPKSDDPADMKVIWDLLSSKVKSDYIQFLADAFWSADWDENLRKKNREEAIGRLQAGDIDLMIAMGTWAGQDLANNLHSVPTMVMSTSNPVQSNIVKSAEDSGYDHVHAKCDPYRYVRQLRLFHNLVGFKKLGVACEDSPEGRTYSAIDDIEKVSKERGFEIIKCEAPFSGVDEKGCVDGIINAHKELAPKVDAVYIPVHRGVVLKYMPEIMAPLYQLKIPTFSQRGTTEVQHGVLFSIAIGDFKEVGMYRAQVIATVFNGAKPRDINQIFADPRKIAINLEVARIIGYEVPPGLLDVADDVYEGIRVLNSTSES